MFNIKKIRVTKIDEFATATEALEAAQRAEKATAFEVRAITDKGDLQLTVDDLKKIAEEEAKSAF